MRRAAAAVLGLIFVVLLLANYVAPHPYAMQMRETPGAAPSRDYPLGTDELGRDRLSRLIYGGRLSLLLAPAAAGFSVVLALLSALSAGCLGRICERAAGALADLCLSLPWLFLLLAIRAVLPLNVSGELSALVTFLALGLLGWAGPFRVMLAAVKRHQKSDFILLARSSGASRVRTALIHLAPNLAPVATAQFLILTPTFLLTEANLGMLGLGIAELMPSWGNMLRDMENFSNVAANPWIAAPAVAVVLVVSCFHLLVSADEYGV